MSVWVTGPEEAAGVKYGHYPGFAGLTAGASRGQPGDVIARFYFYRSLQKNETVSNFGRTQIGPVHWAASSLRKAVSVVVRISDVAGLSECE